MPRYVWPSRGTGGPSHDVACSAGSRSRTATLRTPLTTEPFEAAGCQVQHDGLMTLSDGGPQQGCLSQLPAENYCERLG